MMTKLRGMRVNWQRTLAQMMADPRMQLYARIGGCFLVGFLFSTAGLVNQPMPLALGFVFGCSGLSSLAAASGSILGYLLFWGGAAKQCILWIGSALVLQLIFGKRLALPLLPAVAALLVSAWGVFFQVWLGQETSVAVYLLRVALAAVSGLLFYRVLRRRDPILDWFAAAFAVLSLAQLSLGVYLNFGIIAGGILAAAGAFPGAVLAGAALDLAGVAPVSMTAVLCIGYLVRFLPACPPYLRATACSAAYLFVMYISGLFSLYPLPALLLGGVLGIFLPLPAKTPARRGETGMAQVRLELAAGAMLQMEQLLSEPRPVPVDKDAILQRSAQNACGGCACRASCKDRRRLLQLPAALLHKELHSAEELPIVCRKSGRFLAELHRGQEQLRSIQADRQRQGEYRAAVEQQYRFMGEYLQTLSDRLGRRSEPYCGGYDASVEVFSNRPSLQESGDRCAVFTGVRDLQYVVLCDGMGTGPEAAREGKLALQLLRRLLTAGYPGEAALRSLNSLCALGCRTGAVTVDLLEIRLSDGKAKLYKWGAAPSYLTGKTGTRRLGQPGPPPGLSVTEQTEQVTAFRLEGHRLVMVSDGVPEEEILRICDACPEATDRELAQSLLRQSLLWGEDDATVAVVRLSEAE